MGKTPPLGQSLKKKLSSVENQDPLTQGPKVLSVMTGMWVPWLCEHSSCRLVFRKQDGNSCHQGPNHMCFVKKGGLWVDGDSPFPGQRLLLLEEWWTLLGCKTWWKQEKCWWANTWTLCPCTPNAHKPNKCHLSAGDPFLRLWNSVSMMKQLRQYSHLRQHRRRQVHFHWVGLCWLHLLMP